MRHTPKGRSRKGRTDATTEIRSAGMAVVFQNQIPSRMRSTSPSRA